jgi:hypothetical protein
MGKDAHMKLRHTQSRDIKFKNRESKSYALNIPGHKEIQLFYMTRQVMH